MECCLIDYPHTGHFIQHKGLFFHKEGLYHTLTHGTELAEVIIQTYSVILIAAEKIKCKEYSILG
jgi:hypothetical protein